jgi:PAT family acetyl-CoA transporter-like MFS transporter 1
LDEGLVSLGGYLQFWGVAFLMCTLWLVLFKKERKIVETVDDIQTVYKTMFQIIRMPRMSALNLMMLDMTKFIILLLISKIGFIANESVTGLKLLEKGFLKEDLALAVLIDFPFQILFGYFAAKWSSGPKPLRPVTLKPPLRLLVACGVLWSFVLCFICHVCSLHFSYRRSEQRLLWIGHGVHYFELIHEVCLRLIDFQSTVQFVSLGSFFSKISDPLIGGTYMTLVCNPSC